ncbi:MAG: hypothetical protein U9R34_08355 [Nanoarchaeota archaeon]|nr:hypothetical protein [Nanoarchaeota archaeon]
MKRKIVKQGAATMTVSLPASWIRKFNLMQGDDIEVQETGKSLVMTTESQLRTEEAAIDITGKNRGYIFRKILGLYCAGTDKITIKHQNQLELIREITDRLIGFGMVKQEKTLCIIQDLSGITNIDFNIIYRRCFRLLIEQSESMLDLVKNNKQLKQIVIMDYSLNQFTDYCLRYLSKRGHEDFQKTPSYYHVICEIEYIGDIMSRLYRVYEPKRKKDTIIFLEKIDRLIKDFYGVCFNMDEDKGAHIIDECKKMRHEYIDSDNPAITNLLQIVSVIKNTFNTVLSLN